MTNLFLVFLGGGLGCVARYGIAQLSAALHIQSHWATLLSNILACALLGFLVFSAAKMDMPNWVKPAVLVGFCGGFSTFSTFSLETLQLFQRQQFAWAIGNILVSVTACLFLLYFLSKYLPKV